MDSFRYESRQMAQQSRTRRLADSNCWDVPLEPAQQSQYEDLMRVRRGENRLKYGARVARSLLAHAFARGGAMTFVYFAEEQGGEAIKVGVTADPAKRLVLLQTGSSSLLRLRGAIWAPRSLETVLHRAFAEWRLQGEWFTPTELLLTVADALIGAEWNRTRVTSPAESPSEQGDPPRPLGETA